MAAYDGQWIQELDSSQPPGTQTKALGDNAIREIKLALLNSFPTAGEAGDIYLGTFSELNDLIAGAVIPKDFVGDWAGDQVALPDGPVGWTICDGRVRPDQTNSPNLVSKFIVGAGPGAAAPPFTSPVGGTGGNAELQAILSGTATFWKGTTDGTVLGIGNLPAEAQGSITLDMSDGAGGSSNTVAMGNGNVDATSAQPVSTVNFNSNAHTHQFKIDTSGTGANIPPYYALLKIIKD
jgi:hypothetical protein